MGRRRPNDRPDPATEAREIARLQRRMQRIEQWKANGGGSHMDFRTGPRQILQETKRQVREVMEDPRFPNDRVRSEEAMKVSSGT